MTTWDNTKVKVKGKQAWNKDNEFSLGQDELEAKVYNEL